MDFKGALLKGLKEIPSSSTIVSKNPPVISKKKSSSSSALQPPKNQPKVPRRRQSRKMGRCTRFPVFSRQHPLMGFTQNLSPTYLSSGNPCMDFFFHVVPDTPPSQLVNRLESSWAHDPLTSLKLICNLRGVRGTGKNDREGFYTAALWLHKHHPKSLASNVEVYASFGCLKDLLEILFRLLEGPDARSLMEKEWKARKGSKGFNSFCGAVEGRYGMLEFGNHKENEFSWEVVSYYRFIL
ncbi:hypothetical protein POM88_014356 [Heracleum sosnowskyi]|uniref:DUF2828 domain-containing protein n=1 Tax=Heracleum sosnowskyi TaxID=360622 RepID=A0AAD8J083_9APIA|nr:hypothetical protein POM88_014356 [Heracleum sosnowskyi]